MNVDDIIEVRERVQDGVHIVEIVEIEIKAPLIPNHMLRPWGYRKGFRLVGNYETGCLSVESEP
jgi:hypothetical protein